MKTYQITFADGLTVRVKGCDHEAAQENAIDELEAAGVVHSAIVSIRVAA
jgi:hypothetical protein